MGINRIPPGDALQRLHAALRQAETDAQLCGLKDVELLVGAAAEAAGQYLAAWEERRPVTPVTPIAA